MQDYHVKKLRLWQANTDEDWKAELMAQGESDSESDKLVSLSHTYRSKGYNIRAAREKAIDARSWHSSGQF